MTEAQTMVVIKAIENWQQNKMTSFTPTNILFDFGDVILTAFRSSAAAAQPVAWTNKAQLGFLDDPACADIPMAMWSKTSPASPIPLYAAVPAAQPDGVREALESIAGWRKVNISAEYEHGLRDIIRSITDCAAAALDATSLPRPERAPTENKGE